MVDHRQFNLGVGLVGRHPRSAIRFRDSRLASGECLEQRHTLIVENDMTPFAAFTGSDMNGAAVGVEI